MTDAWPLELQPRDPVAGWRSGMVRIGSGELGGKGNGLVFFRDMLQAEFNPVRFPGLTVAVPPFAVVTTEIFDTFVAAHDLARVIPECTDHEQVVRAFQAAPLPASVREVLARLLENVQVPLAVRSSSILEDAIFCPLAGLYETKMIPNSEADPAVRLQQLELAIKLVFASTYDSSARAAYLAMGKDPSQERMAVLIQQIVGDRAGGRFYPPVSGVARSYNYYPSGTVRREEGVVNLALGLGKTIVEGGVTWSYAPTRPRSGPTYGSVQELLNHSQLSFWCVELEAPQGDAQTCETEFLSSHDLSTAEEDGMLDLIASTYDGRSDRVFPGVGRTGPRVLDFAPLLTLNLLPFNQVIRELLAIGERAAGTHVEMEFALQRGGDSGQPMLGLLQIRPMSVSNESVTIEPGEWSRDDLLLSSRRVMGNGTQDGLRDVVFVKPDSFQGKHTTAIAAELAGFNRRLVEAGRHYLLIGFGRWGSSDPWLGIPVTWDQICGARVIVEATLPSMNVEPSQGSHFFHNISNCGIPYLSVHHDDQPGIDWSWLLRHEPREETRFVRHVELDAALRVKVDGATGRGAVWR